MKKIISIVTVLVLCFALLLPATVSAASASATLTGPAAVRAGDTITLTLNLSGNGLFGASATHQKKGVYTDSTFIQNVQETVNDTQAKELENVIDEMINSHII